MILYTGLGFAGQEGKRAGRQEGKAQCRRQKAKNSKKAEVTRKKLV